jgi:ATP-dependent Lhr-like helicase
VATKSFPQWCYRPNLEEIHRLTLQRLRKEMEPAPPEVYADFLVRWQHLHAETRLERLDGLRSAIAQLQGHETYQILFEQDLFPSRVSTYDGAMLDRLCQTGEVIWRRFDTQRLRRGQIGFAFRTDQAWLVPNPDEIKQDFSEWDEDIPEQCNVVRDYLRDHGASYFDDIVAGTALDWRYVLRAVWHLVWTGEATNDSYEAIRYAEVASGLSGCYDLATRPTKKGVTLDFIVRHMLENKQLDPRLGRWAPTERLVPFPQEAYDAEDAAARWAAQLIRRYGIVTKEVLKWERGAPGWRDLRRALAKQELLGEVRRGYFVEGLSGEQYGSAEAVEALRAAKLRQGNGADPGDLVLVNLYDPANPFGTLFPITDEVGNEIKQMNTPTKYLVLRQGQPILLYAGNVTLLTDLSRATTAAAIGLLTSIIDAREPWRTRTELAIRDWNGHPTRVSPARHLLVTLGFYPVDNRWRGYVYDGETFPDAESVVAAEKELLDLYERHGKEEAPIIYDADWVISQAEPGIRPKVAELIAWLKARLPDACEFIYRPRYFKDFQVLYRGMRCINPHIQRKKIRLQIAHKGWSPGILIYPETELDAGDFAKKFDAQFRKTCAQIDGILDAA